MIAAPAPPPASRASTSARSVQTTEAIPAARRRASAALASRPTGARTRTVSPSTPPPSATGSLAIAQITIEEKGGDSALIARSPRKNAAELGERRAELDPLRRQPEFADRILM